MAGLKTLLSKWFKKFFGEQESTIQITWQENWAAFLSDKVAFYRTLSKTDKGIFENRVLLFSPCVRLVIASNFQLLLTAMKGLVLSDRRVTEKNRIKIQNIISYCADSN